MVKDLPGNHRQKRNQELFHVYHQQLENTENATKIQVTETGQDDRWLQIPELIQNFSHDFWIHKIKAKFLEGETISDEDLVYLLLVRLKFADVQQYGYVLEDFPENLKQKRILDSHKVTPNLVFLIDGVLESRTKQLAAYLNQISYLRFLEKSLLEHTTEDIINQIVTPPKKEEKPENETEEPNSDAEISEDEPEPETVFNHAWQESVSDLLRNCLSKFESKKKQIELLSWIVASKLLLQNRFELLSVLYLYKEQYDNVRVLSCEKDSLFNLLLVKKSLRYTKVKLQEVLYSGFQKKAYRIAGLGLSRSNILKNLSFVDDQFICAVEYVKNAKRELLECSRENMIVLGDTILPVKSSRIQEVIDK
jgi:adenylate kinase family enzyme